DGIMREWRAGLVVCWLVVGCGGPLREEAPSADVSSVEASEVSSQACEPTAGEAQRVKVILPPSTTFSRFAEMPESLVEFRGLLYFAINFEDRSRALWKSDGTEAGTVEVKAFPPLPSFSFDRLGGLAPAGDKLFFLASEATSGNELWVTDGTSGGTRQVVELTPGAEGSFLSHLTGLG